MLINSDNQSLMLLTHANERIAEIDLLSEKSGQI